MHPVVIIVPAAALIFGPRLWVNHVLRQYHRKEETIPATAGELARAFLDRHQLYNVVVESTDLGDHYDPEARAVRLGRDKIERRTLTAVATAAHEVAHAIQHATGYGPFVWRARLAKLAQVTGEVGFAVLLAVPVTALVSRQPVPPLLVGTAAFAMLGTGMAAQLAAVPTELDASFARALPMLRDGYISSAQVKDVRKILMACSLTYIASSLVAVLHIWPWLGRRPAAIGVSSSAEVAYLTQPRIATGREARRRRPPARRRSARLRKRDKVGVSEIVLRQFGKPLIRGWIRLSRSL